MNRCIVRPSRGRLVVVARSQASSLKGQHVIILGLGKSGRAAAKLALLLGARVTALDHKVDTLQLECDATFTNDPRLASLGASYRTLLGPHPPLAPLAPDYIVCSPGVPMHLPVLQQVLLLQQQQQQQQHDDDSFSLPNIRVLSEVSFAYQALPPSLPIAAITGTNGKSTVTTFTGQLLASMGRRAWVGGNLGTPLSDLAATLLLDPQGYDCAVVEVSSYQLELPDNTFRAHCAVITNLTPDHLERHGNMERYANIKLRIFDGMGVDSVAIVPEEELLLSRALREQCEGRSNAPRLDWTSRINSKKKKHTQAKRESSSYMWHFDMPSRRNEPRALSIDFSRRAFQPRGAHNRQNAALAILLTLAILEQLHHQHHENDNRTLLPALQSAVATLQAPPHRIQEVGCVDRVVWVNDSKATNIESMLVAIQALSEDEEEEEEDEEEEEEKEEARGGVKRIVLLLGGQGKKKQNGAGFGFDEERVVDAMNASRVACIVTYGRDGDRIAEEVTMCGTLRPSLTRCVSFDEAVDVAHRLASQLAASMDKETVLLLSPACASFDAFTNFEHRGAVFAAKFHAINNQSIRGGGRDTL